MFVVLYQFTQHILVMHSLDIMSGSTFFLWNVSCLGVKPFHYNLDCCIFDPVSSVFQYIFLTCYAECINSNFSYWGCLPVCYFHAYFITACIWSASKGSIELTFQTRRFMVKLPVCTWGTGDWYFFCMIVFEMKKGSIHILCELFFIVFQFKGPAHCHSSSQVQLLHCVLYTMYSLHSFPIIFGECYHKQQGWGSHSRVAEDSPGMQCCVSGQETQHHISENLDLVTSSSFSSFQLNQAPVSLWVHFSYAFQLIHKCQLSLSLHWPTVQHCLITCTTLKFKKDKLPIASLLSYTVTIGATPPASPKTDTDCEALKAKAMGPHLVVLG